MELPLVVLAGLPSELRERLRGPLEAAGFPVREELGGTPESALADDTLLLAPLSGRTPPSAVHAPASEALAHLPEPPYAVPASETSPVAAAGVTERRRPNLLKRALEAPERAVLAWALRQTGGNREKAARLLGLHRATLFAKLRKHGIRNGNLDPRSRR